MGCEHGKVRGYAGVCVDVRFGYVWMFVGERVCVFCNCGCVCGWVCVWCGWWFDVGVFLGSVFKFSAIVL